MNIALAGIGEVAVQQHLPALQASTEWTLIATCSRNGSLPGIPAFNCLEKMLDTHPQIDVVSLCHPPGPRYPFARAALDHHKHVMLEKPPGATISECLSLQTLANTNNRSLFATWHSRQADRVQTARRWLVDKEIKEMSITWREDVRRWHAGQEWIWQPGGFGVLDPGINALSIVTEILPGSLYPTAAEFLIPANKHTPIAADIEFGYESDGACSTNATIHANFDWREKGQQQWNIRVLTDDGELTLSNGGANLLIDGVSTKHSEHYEDISSDEASNTLGNEYRRLYARMAELIRTQKSDVDLSPLQLVADSYLIATTTRTEPFID